MAEDKAPTHTAYALKREGKRIGRWLEIGTARIDGPEKPAYISLDRTPIGLKPPQPEPEPERPAQFFDADEP